MTIEEIKKIYKEEMGHEECTQLIFFGGKYINFLTRIGVKIDPPEKKIEVTRSQLIDALGKALINRTIINHGHQSEMKDIFLKELGFE